MVEKNTHIALPKAVLLALADYRASVISEFELGVMIFGVVNRGEVEGRRLFVKGRPQRRHFTAPLVQLVDNGILTPIRHLPAGSVYRVMGREDPEVHEVLCTADPFAFLSHLSAMEIHGLTDRVAHSVFATTPDPKSWRVHAGEMMRAQLGKGLSAYLDGGFPPLVRHRFEKILGRPVHLTHSIHRGAFKKLEGGRVRVSSVGRTFLDMLRQPDLCGGITHVLDVYVAQAKTYASLIVAEIEQHGLPIDKVRAGYVLEELCGLALPVFKTWLKAVRRGGSRKLVGSQPYSSTFSEKWCLSLNAA